MNAMREEQSKISDVLIRYATGIDQRDWPLFRSCWTPDVVADYGQIGVFTGVEALTGFMITAHEAMGPTHHRLSNFVIDIDRDHADVRSYVHAVLIAVPEDPSSWIDALGTYEDVFVRTATGWQISKRVVRMARIMTAKG